MPGRHDLGRQLARMMWWAGVSYYPTVALITAAAVLNALEVSQTPHGFGSSRIGLTLHIAFLCALVTAVIAVHAIAVFWVVTLWHIFWAGQMAFGTGSGLVYLLLACVLLPWPGLYVIPHMLRLDVKRLLDVEPMDPRNISRWESGQPPSSLGERGRW